MDRNRQIRRISVYEAMMDDAGKLVASGRTSAELARLIGALDEYYQSPQWKQDYADDEAGLLPGDLKRGVLSEDGIYNLIEEYKALAEEAAEEADADADASVSDAHADAAAEADAATGSSLTERIYETPCGAIHYWVNASAKHDSPQLVFLPGLTADHRLFEKQLGFFEGEYPVFVWDAPGHASSWPFSFDFDLMDKAKWLDEILTREGFADPVVIGQSMGGYVGQAYAQLFPEKLRGFVAVDSAPLQREYVTAAEIGMLKRMEPVYRHYPWKYLLKHGTNGVATSGYGRRLMREIMMGYDGDQERYAKLAGHGFRILAEAMEAGLPYEIKCPALLICGEKDRAGSCRRYNKAWHKKSGIPIRWIRGAGHNSNTDAPETVNRLISGLVERI